MLKNNKYINKIKYYYKLAKEKKIDSYMILAGAAGVLLGLVCSIPIINKIFAWFILFGVVIKLYDFSEEIEKNIVPYDFNRLLPPPKK
ncbi:hypothetical protein AMRN_1158 [Malaciobacter marinus]|uniref:Uncharacterized protein n=1 Tax=Malaciobacter marinus TaxID=505249 RepID=A0A347TJX7_9BACT|nr:MULTISPECIES: hypothetical protein [Malaciobacter]AXX86905.1 hypothetical protein AMRN_1158 [Malaciobacter marinus]PHO11811.1 hypothetical protein CPG38_11115 [Malaciobacter marinus]PHO15861.1 hypothetical protein CPH92_04625 [Malaciobacter marinus]RYA23788.1 hypothetical protein CRU96_05990 [Malaciobacter halophilus]